MHIVTKILIVFCAILSLLLSALTMAYASNANALRQEVVLERARSAAIANEQMANAGARGIELATAEDKRKAIEGQLAAAQNEISRLQAEKTDLTSREQQARAEANAIRNQISQLGATADTQAALIKSYRDEATVIREKLLTGEKRQIELLDRINDLESSREVLEQNARALKEQLEETKLALQSAQQQAQGGGSSAANSLTARTLPRELTGPLVTARVTQTFKSPAGDDMVEINEGSNRGIKPNTLMTVVRGDGQFVASIVITVVEPTRSVGKVTLTKMNVGNDDRVLSRLD